MRAVILVLALLASPSLSSTTLSCFSFGLLDLPTFGFSGEEVVTEKSKEMEPGEVRSSPSSPRSSPSSPRSSTNSFDACFWGLISFVVFSVVPAGLKSEVARVRERLTSLPSLAASPDIGNIDMSDMDGNRRLDLNIYNYVDTSGPGQDISLSPPPSLYTPPPPAYPPSQFYPQYSPPESQYSPPQSQYSSPESQYSSLQSQYSPEHPQHSPSYSPPISSSFLQDDWEGKLGVSHIHQCHVLLGLPKATQMISTNDHT